MLKNAEEKVSPDGRTEMQEARKKKKKAKKMANTWVMYMNIDYKKYW